MFCASHCYPFIDRVHYYPGGGSGSSGRWTNHTAWWSGPDADPDAYATFQYLCRTVACTTRSR